MEKKISVVIPVYNSARTIEKLAERLTRLFEEKKRIFEIILVDDGSRDGSGEILKNLSEHDARIKAIILKQNVGQQAAIKRGLKKADGQLIVTIDDDLEQQPEDIFGLLFELEKGYDVVYGIPERQGYPFYRKLGSNMVDLFFTLVLKKPANIRVGSFRVMNVQTARKIIGDQTPFVYITAITLKFTRNIGNVKVGYEKRAFGKSNYTIKKLVRLYIKLLYYYGIRYRK